MTNSQTEATIERTDYILSYIFTDPFDREAVKEAIIDDVISDIECTADWGELEDDEICYDDIDIAIARTIKDKLTE